LASAGRVGYGADVVLCPEVGDRPCEEVGEWPEVKETELEAGVRAGVPEELDWDECVARIGAVLWADETCDAMWPRPWRFWGGEWLWR
jgi:hypothetical protein